MNIEQTKAAHTWDITIKDGNFVTATFENVPVTRYHRILRLTRRMSEATGRHFSIWNKAYGY